MSLLDKLKQQAEAKVRTGIQGAANSAASGLRQQVTNAASNKQIKVVLTKIPTNLEELQAMPQAELKNPEDTAALTIAALAMYPVDRQASIEMLNFLRGPRPLSGHDLSFIKDRFMDGQDYLPFSYFDGATPDNDYNPSEPYTITFIQGPYAKQEEGYIRLDVRSGGADSPRQITLRLKPSTGQWFLWEQYILVGIRQPKSADPWA